VQLRVQAEAHCPVPMHDWPAAQVPHDPPQPSDPQRRPLHEGVHGVTQWLLRQTRPLGHDP
jgi:hypothetical protein